MIKFFHTMYVIKYRNIYVIITDIELSNSFIQGMSSSIGTYMLLLLISNDQVLSYKVCHQV